MKNIFLLLVFTSFTFAFAQEEHLDFDENLERDCYEESRKLSCLDSEMNQMEDCLDKKHQSLSDKCQNFHNERKKRKSN